MPNDRIFKELDDIYFIDNGEEDFYPKCMKASSTCADGGFFSNSIHAG